MKYSLLYKSILAIVFSLALFSCKKDDPIFNSAGNWHGTASDNIGDATITTTISQTGKNLSGVYTSSSGFSANITGTINDKTANITLTPTQPGFCDIHAVVVFSDVSHATGQYSAVSCTIPITGTLSITK